MNPVKRVTGLSTKVNKFLLALPLFMIDTECMKALNGSEKIRETIVSGIFYPDNPHDLVSFIDPLIGPYPDVPSFAIIAPHAGFSFSGTVAAAAWNSTQGRNIDTVVIIAPRHREPEPFLFLPESSIFSTPFGDIHTSHELIEDLLSCSTIFSVNDIPHLEEHGIEVQLPFMKRLFPKATLVPILVGSIAQSISQVLSRSLDIVFQGNYASTLFVVSSNLYSNMDPLIAQSLSLHFLDLVSKKDCTAIMNDLEKSPDPPCGSACIAGLLSSTLFKTTRVKILATSNSREAEGPIDDSIKTVHYAAIAIIGGGG